MYDADSKGISYRAGFFMLIAFAVAGVFIASVISIPVWTQMTGEDFREMEKGLSNPANRDAVKMIQVITAVIGFLLPVVCTAWLMNRKPFRLMGFGGRMDAVQVILVFALMIAGLFVSSGLGSLNEIIPLPASWQTRFENMEKEYLEQVQAVIQLNSSGQYLLSLFIMAFLPALCEEALFRGGFQNFLSRSTNRPWLSIVIVSVFFSILHFSYFGFLPRFFLGIVLGAIYYYSGRLWLSIWAHFLNNAVAISVLYFFSAGDKPVAETMQEAEGSLWGLLAIPVVIGLLVVFRKQSPPPLAAPKNPEREELRNTPFY